MNLAYRSHSQLSVLSLALAVAACSGSSNKSNPDAQPDANSTIDAAIEATFETATLVVTGPSPDFLTAAVSLAGGCLGKCGTGVSAVDAGNASVDGGPG